VVVGRRRPGREDNVFRGGDDGSDPVPEEADEHEVR
jgi:hypothetical protein